MTKYTNVKAVRTPKIMPEWQHPVSDESTITWAVALKSKRKTWEGNVNSAQGELYSLLGHCLSFHKYLESGPETLETLVKHLNAQGIKGNKGTRLSTLVVRTVFGNGKRTFAYAKVLELAVKENLGVRNSMRDFIVERGGIEAIRRGEGSAKKSADARAANLRKASEHFSKSTALGSPITVTDAGRTLEEGRLFVAIMREEADGNYSMVYETPNGSLLNSALTDARKTIPGDNLPCIKVSGSDKSDPTGTTGVNVKVSPMARAKALDSENGSTSMVETGKIDVRKEPEPQGDAKSVEKPAEPSTGKPRRCAETLRVKLPLAVKQRLAALAA